MKTLVPRARAGFRGLRIALVLWVLFVWLGAPGCSSSKVGGTRVGHACRQNSDCASPFICSLGSCTTKCKTARDCEDEGSCVTDGKNAVCQSAADKNKPCEKQAECPSPLACASDYRCRNLCSEDADCNVLGVSGRRCAEDTNGVEFCADPPEVSGEGKLIALPPPGHPDGGVEPITAGAGGGGGSGGSTNPNDDGGSSGETSTDAGEGGTAGNIDEPTTAGTGGTVGGAGAGGTVGQSGAGAGGTVGQSGAGTGGTSAAGTGGKGGTGGGAGTGGTGGQGNCQSGADCALGETCSPTSQRCSLAFTQLFAGYSHICALAGAGTVWCWGDNQYGQLGDNTVALRNRPVQVLDATGVGPLKDIVQVSAGTQATCARKADGNVWCWGNNALGGLGDNTITTRRLPTPVKDSSGLATLTEVTHVATSYSSACAVLRDGYPRCWGGPPVGDATSSPRSLPVLVNLDGVAAISMLNPTTGTSAGAVRCALRTNGDVWCWGANNVGQLGQNTVSGAVANVPLQVKGPGGVGFLSGVAQVLIGGAHVCARKPDSSVWCWGTSTANVLGDGSGQEQRAPVQVRDSSGSGFLVAAAVAVGVNHNCAVLNDGTVQCWGNNTYGQLGDSTISEHALPTLVPLFPDVASISAGNGYTCALKTDGSAYCWGANNLGQLGNGSASNTSRPVLVSR